MLPKLYSLAVLVLLSGVFIRASFGRCIWYDICYYDQRSNTEKACPYFEEAKPLQDDTAADYLLRHCPHLFERVNGTVKTCCSPHQIKNLKVIFDGLKGVAGQCPSCYSNMVHLFCGFTCGTDQASFMTEPEISQPAETVEVELPSDPTLAAIFRRRHPNIATRPHDTCSAHSFISSVSSVRVNKTTVDSIVESCANVRYRGSRVFTSIFAAPMTAHSLFQYIGNPGEFRQASVKLNFVTVSETENEKSALSFTTYACNETEPMTKRRCVCHDCPASCSEGDWEALSSQQASARATSRLMNSDYAILMTICFTAVASVMLALVLAYRLYSERHYLRHTLTAPLGNIVVSENNAPLILVEHKKLLDDGDVVFNASQDARHYSSILKN